MSDIREGVSPKEKPQFAVVCNDPEHCVGVFSWHLDEGDAQHNAELTGGQVVPVDYVDGELIVPPLAVSKMNRFVDEYVNPFDMPMDEE